MNSLKFIFSERTNGWAEPIKGEKPALPNSICIISNNMLFFRQRKGGENAHPAYLCYFLGSGLRPEYRGIHFAITGGS
jgi:hypothetical protein